MSYGIQIFNDDGVPVFDTLHPTLRQVGAGTTAALMSAFAAVEAAFYARPDVQATPVQGRRARLRDITGAHWMRTNNSYGEPVDAYMAGVDLTLQYVSETDVTYTPAPVWAASSGGGWSAFYQFDGTPIWGSLEVEFDSAEFDEGTFCAVTGQRPYRLTAPIPTPGGYDTDWGLQTLDEAGTVLFDSRDTFLPVRFACIIPIATAQDVLLNGAEKLITLPEPMPDCWVSIPTLNCCQSEAIEYYCTAQNCHVRWRYNYVQIEQIDATTLKVSKKVGPTLYRTHPTSQSHPSYPAYYDYAHDIIVYVARNPT